MYCVSEWVKCIIKIPADKVFEILEKKDYRKDEFAIFSSSFKRYKNAFKNLISQNFLLQFYYFSFLFDVDIC